MLSASLRQDNSMKPFPSMLRVQDAMNRRTFLSRTAAGIGMAALGSIMGESLQGATSGVIPTASSASGHRPLGLPGFPNFPAKAKRVIFLFQAGGPSQMDMFDYKPQL